MATKEQRALLLDIGTTSIKARICTPSSGEIHYEASRVTPGPLSGLPSGRSESDAEELRRETLDIIEECVRECDPRILAMSTQMHSIILTDLSGTPLTPLISWQDNRLLETSPRHPGSTLEEIESRIPAVVRSSSGVALRPGYGAGNLMSYLRENPRLRREPIHVHTVGSYLLQSLGAAPSTHITNAAALGIIDLDTEDWSQPLIEAYELSNCILPTISRGYAPIGEITVGGKLLEIYPDLADHQASVVGAGGLGEGDVALSMGTAGIVARWSSTRSLRTDIDSRPYPGGGYLLTASRQPGGWVASSITGFFADVVEGITGNPTNHAQVWGAIEKALGPEPLHELHPHLRFEQGSSPDDGEAVRIRGINQRDGNAIRDLMASLIQIFVDRYAAAIDVIYENGDSEPQTLFFNGGLATKGSWFRDQIVNGLGLKVAPDPDTELALRGLAYLLHRGLTSSHTDPMLVPDKDRL